MAHEHVAHHASADDEYRETPTGAGHEHTDASVGAIVKFAVWMAIIAVGVHFGSKLMFDYFVATEQAATRLDFPLAGSPTEMRLPPEPRLQRFPANESYQHRLLERHMVTTYGWVDKAQGTVRLPMDEAMRLAVTRGLPARGQATAPAAVASPEAPVVAEPAQVVETPGLMPTDSSAGRLLERRRQ